MNDKIFQVLVSALVLVTAFPVHEFAHAWAADKLGDHTARGMGRLTLNPLAHIDWLGAICMLLTGFGWAKPVPINPNNFKHRKWGMAISSLAGPMSNAVMAFIGMILLKVIYYTGGNSSLLNVFSLVVSLNIGLAVFNFLPIPPLDGSRIFTLFLSEKTYFKIMQYENIIFIVLLVLLYFDVLTKPLSFLINKVVIFMDFITRFVDLIFGVIG